MSVSDNSKKTSSYLAKGNSALQSNNYEEAISLFKKALIQIPELSDVINFNIAIAKRKAGISDLNTADDSPDTKYRLKNAETKIDVVVPVYNALEEVKKCLFALEKNTDGFDLAIYVINDGSDIKTTEWLRNFCKHRAMFALTENEKNKGYTPTVNIGLRRTRGDFIVTLNSDAIVTKGWINSMIHCFKSDTSIGVVGPLSNAASWQNVPILLDEKNQFAVNELPHGFTPDLMAELVRSNSLRLYPKVPFVNGFCFMISRKALDTVGLLDEKTFPTGYGEENDYCIRIAAAGFKLAICDSAYVFHAKSKSFGHEKRKELSKAGSNALKVKHGKEKVNELADRIRSMTIFDEIRTRVIQGLDKGQLLTTQSILHNRILFLLPVSGGGGGVHSIVQETMGMVRIGINAKIAVPNKHRIKFIKKYSDIDIVEDLFIGFEGDEILTISKNFNVVIGTIFTSMKIVKKIVEFNKDIKPAYYVQDYEPLFFRTGSPDQEEAYNSYTLVQGAILFAKTEWICQKVFEEHGVSVRKVSPSIDHDVYKPLNKKVNNGKVTISAMIRPKTPRRGAERTMLLLKDIYNAIPDRIQINIFGCEEDDAGFLKLERNFEYMNHGELTREGVASVLQQSDCFIDLSDYQAFGRTGLEAMACGAFLVITQYGGVYEYAKHLENALIVDPFKEIDITKLLDILQDNYKLSDMKNKSILTASHYSIHRAVISELNALN